MNASSTNSLKITTADTFQKSLRDNPFYFFIGGTSPWEDEAEPPKAVNDVSNIIESVGDVVGLKRIREEYLQSVIERFDWGYNKTFDQYDDTLDLSSESIRFYVVTDEGNVYKCLDNNNGRKSTIKPSGTDTVSVKYSDGYIWKYMYSLTETDREEFKGMNYIPCYSCDVNVCPSQLKVQNKAVDGSIERVDVIEGGIGYREDETIELRMIGDGYGFKAEAVTGANGQITKVIVKDAGQCYRNAHIEVFSESGFGAILKPVLSPIGGHGSNAKEELHAIHKMVDMRLDGTEGGYLPVDITYRKIGILARALSTEKGLSVKVTNINYFMCGDKIESKRSSATGTVRSIDYENSILFIEDAKGKFEITDEIYTETDTNSVILNIVQTNNLPLSADVVNGNKYLQYSGKLLWFKNITPVKREFDKVDEFKFIVSF